ncbi:MAG: carotenoid 1,2-hydratase [Alphaproteobacteria bacterium]|nr:carotenoid 1,2-hydratase [Alphaproteobacteria bacterium]
MSHDKTRAISIIAFIGSVFSPWYAWSGRKAPHNHCCINVATYGPGGRFTMTERPGRTTIQTPDSFHVGPSSFQWTDDGLVINIDEYSAPPIPGRVKGRILLKPHFLTSAAVAISKDDAHMWRPFAPRADISVELEAPGWQWSGEGYMDANFGDRSLEEDFQFWTWGRFPSQHGSYCFYDAERTDGSKLEAAFLCDEDGNFQTISAPTSKEFKPSLWRVKRNTRTDVGENARQIMNMLDAPFYSRSMIETYIHKERVTGIHEALDMRRFNRQFIKAMIAMRTPRIPAWLTPSKT